MTDAPVDRLPRLGLVLPPPPPPIGEIGQHARSAVGFGSLPGQITVEIEAVVAVEPPSERPFS